MLDAARRFSRRSIIPFALNGFFDSPSMFRDTQTKSKLFVRYNRVFHFPINGMSYGSCLKELD